MDPKTQSSFIPKKPVLDGSSASTPRRSLFSLIATIIFVATVGTALGVFGYNYYLKKKITDMDRELTNERKNLDPALVAELTRLNNRIENSKKVLGNHVSSSLIFDALQVLTLETVRFKNFQFGDVKDDSLVLSMDGVGRSFNSVTLQSDILRKEKSFKNPIFSDLALDDNGNVTFKLKMTVDPSLILYSNTLVAQEIPVLQPETPASSADSTSTPTGASVPKTP